MINIKEKRLQSLFNKKSDNAVIVPVDYGFFMGSAKGLEDPYNVVQNLIKCEVEGTIMSFGLGKIMEDLFTAKNKIAKILSADYLLMSKIPGEEEGILGNLLYSSVEQAIKWGFCAIKVILIWGTEPNVQLEAIKYVGKIARECDKHDMPLIIEPLLLGKYIPKEKKNDPQVIINASRIALEMGADILKVPYTGDKESFSQIVKHSHVPVLILGGPKTGGIKGILQTVKDSIEAGGRGLVFGRNVWQNPKMDNIISALKDIVHKNCEVNEVLKRYYSADFC